MRITNLDIFVAIYLFFSGKGYDAIAYKQTNKQEHMQQLTCFPKPLTVMDKTTVDEGPKKTYTLSIRVGAIR